MICALLAAACSGSVELEPAGPENTPSPEENTPEPDNEPIDTGSGDPDTDEPTPTPEVERDPEPSDVEIPAFTAPDPDPTLLPLNPDVRIGVLDNGLTYYLLANSSPGGALELRMAVNAGSMQQSIVDSGRAHFLEHMLFNGTEEYPGNELDVVLRSIGAQIGPDLNAYTSADETVYILSLGSVDDETVDTGFNVLRQWAGAATIEPDAVIDERGVVLEEYRLGISDPNAAVFDLFTEAYTAGTPYENADPIGTEDNITSTDADQLRELYEDWYRPDLMAIVAVGDLSLDEMERQVVDRFSDLENPADAPERVDPIVTLIDEPFVEAVPAPEQAEKYVSIDFSLQAWDSGTVGGERLQWTEVIMGLMIQSRLLEARDAGENSLINASVGPFGYHREQSFLGFNADASDLGQGTADILTELHRLRVTGFEPEELARAADQVVAFLESEAAGADTKQDRVYADSFVANYLSNGQISATLDWTDRITALMKDLTVDDINNHLRWMMASSAPLVIVVAPDADDLPSKAELETIVEQSEADGLASAGVATSDVIEIDQLMEAPDPVEPIDEGRVDDPSARWWTYENGVTVIFRDSAIDAGQVVIETSAGGGWSLLEPGDGPVTAVATDAVTQSGIADIGRASLSRFLADSTAYASPYIAETREGFFAGGTPDDLETAFQLMHLLITEPRVDQVGLRSAVASAEDSIRFATTDPTEFLINEVTALATDFNPYQVRVVTQEQVDAMTADSLLDLYNQRFSTVDDMVVVVVGDIGRTDVEDLADRYLGTLPGGPSDTWEDINGPLPSEIIEEVRFGEAGTTATVLEVYVLEYDVDPGTQVAGKLFETILNERIFDQVREQLGASYGGSAFFQFEYEPIESIQISVLVDGDPDQIDLIRETVNRELADIVANGVDADEYERAVAIVENDYAFVSNTDYIAHLLQWAQHPDEPVLTTAIQLTELDATGLGAVNEIATQLVSTGAHIEVTRVPN